MTKFAGDIDGDVIVRKDDDCSTLTSVGGSLYIRTDAKLDALTSVGGSLDIWTDAKLDAAALTSVGGSLYIRTDAKLDALTSVGGSLYIWTDAKLDALTSVGGSLDIRTDAKLDAAALTSVGSLHLERGAGYSAPLLAKIAGHVPATGEKAAARLIAVAKHAVAPKALDMGGWHCGTAHCVAGWAIHLEGKAGYALENQVGPEAAGAILLGTEAARLFFLDTDTARSALHRVLDGKPALEPLS
ncbi:MAG: hypothetical protein H0U66_09640 [Gemmatimonadaceae bacterium]|nr:hypothetical protein [Gemmatimonadaceae bacterium]